MSASLSDGPATSNLHEALHEALHEVFGFAEFRALQAEAVEATLSGRDVLVVMPTGAGKSLCYQLPAALSQGVTVVVSPLVALMRDQVEALRERTTFGHAGCAYINSLQSPDEQAELLHQLREGSLKLVYIAPERFRSQAFVSALKAAPIARFVVDEAHCISEWGHDFRPDYLALKKVVLELGGPPLMAVTATATRRVQESIVANLGMREPQVFIGGFDRPNLHFAVHRCKTEIEKSQRLARALPKLAAMGGSGLIYVATRRQCEEIGALAAAALAPTGKKAGCYHAGMDPASRNLLQSQWLAGEIHTLVATNAFGMGIDKPNVRFVVHFVPPDSLESYYQEAGRAGRDGRKSRCVILYHYMSDRRLREFFIDNDALSSEAVQRAHTLICARSPEETVRIPRPWWNQELGWSELKTRLALSEMERAEVVQRLGETGDETILRLTTRRFPPAALRRITNDLQRQHDERYVRLGEMLAYCKTTTCRRRTVLSYFGDHDDLATSDFCCDNCDTPAAPRAPVALPQRSDRAAMPAQVSGSDLHALLQGLDALWPRVGKARLNKLLRGSNAKDVQTFKTQNCPIYGVLGHASQSQVDDFLDALIERGLLHQADEDDYFVCTVTRAGREAWQTQAPLDVALPGATRRSNRPAAPASNGATPGATPAQDDEDDEFSAASSALFGALRTWRRTRAVAENVPPYCVLGDHTLREIARQQPQSENELRGIKGIGDSKMSKYGAAILKITRGQAAGPDQKLPQNAASPVIEASPKPATLRRPQERLAKAVVELSDTIADTYVLLQEGHDIEQIAAQRGLASGTVWTHIEQLTGAGLLDEAEMSVLVPSAVRERIEAALSELPSDAALRAVWDKLNGEIDYGPIRCVFALFQAQRKDDEAAGGK